MFSTFKRILMAGGATCALVATLATSAMAGPSYSFTVRTANQGGAQFDAANPATGFNAAGAITATFNYNGPLSFNVGPPQNNNNAGDLNSAFFGANAGAISSYSGAGSLPLPSGANFSTLASFLGSSGSAANYQYGSLYTIGLGVLSAGTRLTITHDDGVSVYQGGVRIGSTTAGPTSAITESVVLSNTGATTLYFGRQNGAPSVLTVAVPEPASIALFGAGLLGLAALRGRRSGKQAGNAAA
ncbi:PEP-CTERM sorting domain-containing protein [Sediminicoccus sp. BL-A-41-H5]|uniref:PEP-CTERM sorting domain-containing protein n=1 Tax=Sediminicoccus sp. BL-A-41-H5 TaxID=3421106 RepID=UPI003D67496D